MNIAKSTPLADIHKLAPACMCAACSHGCTMGSGLLAGGDLQKLAAFLRVTEQQLKAEYLEKAEHFNREMWHPKLQRTSNKPYGKCIFYDAEKGCTVHEAKPLQCKIAMGCKPYGAQLIAWFVLNHILNIHDPEALRQYADYIAAGGTVIPGGSMEELLDKETMEKVKTFKLLR